MKLLPWVDIKFFFNLREVDAFSPPFTYHHPTKADFQMNSEPDSSGISTGESV